MFLTSKINVPELHPIRTTLLIVLTANSLAELNLRIKAISRNFRLARKALKELF